MSATRRASRSSRKAWLSKVQRPSNTNFISKLTLFYRAFVCEEHSDCKLICGPHEFKLHKIVLMLQSGYFRNAFKKGTFKVYTRY